MIRQSGGGKFWKRGDCRWGPIQRRSGRAAKEPSHIKLQLAIPYVLQWYQQNSVMKPKEACVVLRLKNVNDNSYCGGEKDCFLFSRYNYQVLVIVWHRERLLKDCPWMLPQKIALIVLRPLYSEKVSLLSHNNSRLTDFSKSIHF